MADGMGPDFLSKSMFFREAEAGPTQQELATMMAPFQGSVEQARSLYGSPEMQRQLQYFGLGGFSPDQIRQSPFLSNQFMQQHPHLGGAFNQAMANAAAVPEAPLVSGAGSGITRAMQGAYGGPELLRQYQVRQLMAPFQAMGMQMPARAEQRRMELLKALEQDMLQRRQMEQQGLQQKAEQIRGQVYAPPGVPGYFQEQPGVPGQFGGAIQPPAGPKGIIEQAIAPSLFGGQGGMQAVRPEVPPGVQFMPYDPAQAEALMRAQHPERFAGAGLAEARTAEQQQETAEGMPGAKVGDIEAQADQRRAEAAYARGGKGGGRGGRAGDLAKWSKQYDDVEKEFSKTKAGLDAALAANKVDKTKGIDQATYDRMLADATASRETQKGNIDKARGAPGASMQGLLGPGLTGPPPQGGPAPTDESQLPWNQKTPPPPPPQQP